MEGLRKQLSCRTRRGKLVPLFAAWVGLVILASCAPAAPGAPAGLATSPVRAFVAHLNQLGAHVQAVAPSKYASWLESAPAAWIKTSRGILDVVFLGSGRRSGAIRWAARPGTRAGRHRYVVRVGGRSRTIDANRPLHILSGKGMLVITDSRPLAAIVRKLTHP